MKIRVRTNLGSAEFPGMPWKLGDVRDVADDVGAMLISRGVAEPHGPDADVAQAIEGITSRPAIADRNPAAIAGKRTQSKGT